MAILWVRETGGTAGGMDDKGVKRATRTLRVKTDSPLYGSVAIRHAPGVPRVGEPYSSAIEFDPQMLCTSITADRDAQDPYYWNVTAEYSSSSRDPERAPDDDDSGDDPLDEEPYIRFRHEKFEQPVERATLIVNGVEDRDHPVVNTVGDPFTPPLTREATRLVLEIRRNEQSYDEQLAFDYGDAVNADVYRRRPPGFWKIKSIEGSEDKWRNGRRYVQVNYVIEGNPLGWDAFPLNAGYNRRHYLAPGKYVRRPIQLADGSTPTSPVPLRQFDSLSVNVPGVPDGTLGIFELPPDADPSEYHYRQFRFYTWLPYSRLGLPDRR